MTEEKQPSGGGAGFTLRLAAGIAAMWLLAFGFDRFGQQALHIDLRDAQAKAQQFANDAISETKAKIF